MGKTKGAEQSWEEQGGVSLAFIQTHEEEEGKDAEPVVGRI